MAKEFRFEIPKNVAVTLRVPFEAAASEALFTGTAWAALTGEALDGLYDDGAGEVGLVPAGTPTESAEVAGVWEIALTAAEANHDRMVFTVSATEIKPIVIEVRTIEATAIAAIKAKTDLIPASPASTALGQRVIRVTKPKGVATTLYFPFEALAGGLFTGTAWAALTGEALDGLYDDGAGEVALVPAGTPTESAEVAGMWTLAMTAAEMDHDEMALTLTADEVKPVVILISTVAEERLRLLYCRWLSKGLYDSRSGARTVYDVDGTTVLGTQDDRRNREVETQEGFVKS